jgi:hypothetical protein
VQILKFSDPNDFFGLAFWSPLAKGTKKFVCGPAFGASLFKLWGLAFLGGGASLLGALNSLGPALLDPALKQGTKNRLGLRSLGSRFLNFEV